MQKRSAKGERKRRKEQGKVQRYWQPKREKRRGREKCGENWEKAPPAAAAKFRGEARQGEARRVALRFYE